MDHEPALNHNKLIKLLTCPLCHKLFASPQLLTCLHIYCKTCLHRHANVTTEDDVKGVQCPQCDTVTALADVTPCARTEHLLSLYDHVTRPKLCLECDSQATYTKFSAISYQGVLNISPPSISVAQ